MQIRPASPAVPGWRSARTRRPADARVPPQLRRSGYRKGPRGRADPEADRRRVPAESCGRGDVTGGAQDGRPLQPTGSDEPDAELCTFVTLSLASRVTGVTRWRICCHGSTKFGGPASCRAAVGFPQLWPQRKGP